MVHGLAVRPLVEPPGRRGGECGVEPSFPWSDPRWFAARPGAAGLRPMTSAAALAGKATLASAPIEVRGDWPGSLPQSALTVVSRMREACLAGVRLVSDRQPERIAGGQPRLGTAAHLAAFRRAPFAWIVVDIGPRDWSKLAYQFGHEFGHVLCNIWGPEANSAERNPAHGWRRRWPRRSRSAAWGYWPTVGRANPPFPGDAAFAGAIRQYRDDLLTKYRAVATEQGATLSLAAWFRARRGALETNGGIGGPARGAGRRFWPR